VNSDSKLIPINIYVYSKRKWVTNFKVTSSNNNNIKHISNLRIKCKSRNHKQKIKEKRNKNTKKYLSSSAQQWLTLEERLISPVHYQGVLCKKIQKGYKKLNSTSSPKTKPSLYQFTNLFPRTRDSMISFTQYMFTNVSQPKVTSLSREPSSNTTLYLLWFSSFSLLRIYPKHEEWNLI